MNFSEIKNSLTAVEYLRQHINEGNYLFDGYERIPVNDVVKDPLKRVFNKPRYNPQTVKFVTSLGGQIDAEIILYQSLEGVTSFRPHFEENNFVLETVYKNSKLYIRVYKNNDRPIVIFHGYANS